jgi:transcriptional regulator with XRE-family HTH domain
MISKLRENVDSRTSYIKSKLGILVPSQIRGLRLTSDMPRQADLAKAAGLHQSRISMFETLGAANMTLETLARLAAAFKVGLVVKFVPFSEMLSWENHFSQDAFKVVKIDDDRAFLTPDVEKVDDLENRASRQIEEQSKPLGSAGSAGFSPSPFLVLTNISSTKGVGAGAA